MRKLYAFGAYANVSKPGSPLQRRVYSAVVIDDQGMLVYKHTGRTEETAYNVVMKDKVPLYKQYYTEGFELVWINRGEYDARKDPGFAKALSAYCKRHLGKPTIN